MFYLVFGSANFLYCFLLFSMGKRSKSNADKEPETDVITTNKNKRRKETDRGDSVIVSSEEQKRKTPKVANEPVDSNEELNCDPVVATTKVKKVKKCKDKHLVDNIEKNPIDEILPNETSKVKTAVKGKKVKKSEAVHQPRSKEKNKKIIFVDDQPQEIPANSGSTNISLSNTKIKPNTFLNEDEAEVNDEEIDKFCDELDDSDNAQYENWVKLIEAKLHSNKKLK